MFSGSIGLFLPPYMHVDFIVHRHTDSEMLLCHRPRRIGALCNVSVCPVPDKTCENKRT